MGIGRLGRFCAFRTLLGFGLFGMLLLELSELLISSFSLCHCHKLSVLVILGKSLSRELIFLFNSLDVLLKILGVLNFGLSLGRLLIELLFSLFVFVLVVGSSLGHDCLSSFALRRFAVRIFDHALLMLSHFNTQCRLVTINRGVWVEIFQYFLNESHELRIVGVGFKIKAGND